MGIEHAEDQFAEKVEATIENAMRLRGILEGEQQCPIWSNFLFRKEQVNDDDGQS